jgi:hypothetical protein
MSDLKLPNFGTYVRVIFRQFCPHSDPTYPFGPISVRITDQTSTSSRNVRTKDRTYILRQNVCIKLKNSCIQLTAGSSSSSPSLSLPGASVSITLQSLQLFQNEPLSGVPSQLHTALQSVDERLQALIWILGNDVNTLLPKANDEVKNA